MKKSVYILFLLCFGCVKKPVILHTKLLQPNKLEISGFNKDLLTDLRQDSVSRVQWLSLLPVYRMPADTDMKDFEPGQPGNYQMNDTSIIFTADTPFIRHQTYFIRLYQYHDNSSIWDLLKNKWKNHRPQYIESTFKP